MQSVSHALVPLHQRAQFDVGQVTGRGEGETDEDTSALDEVARRRRSPVQVLQVGHLPALRLRAPLALLLNRRKEGRCEFSISQLAAACALTASLFSSSLTAWMVSLHSAIRLSYRCSLVSSLDACTQGHVLITTPGCTKRETRGMSPMIGKIHL